MKAKLEAITGIRLWMLAIGVAALVVLLGSVWSMHERGAAIQTATNALEDLSAATQSGVLRDDYTRRVADTSVVVARALNRFPVRYNSATGEITPDCGRIGVTCDAQTTRVYDLWEAMGTYQIAGQYWLDNPDSVPSEFRAGRTWLNAAEGHR